MKNNPNQNSNQNTNPTKRIVAYSDGWVTRNGTFHARAGGSTAAYDISNLKQGIFKGTQVNHDLIAQQPLLFHKQLDYNHKNCDMKEFLPSPHTNNTSEAMTMYLLLLELHHRSLISKDSEILVLADSELVLNQLQGIYRVNQPGLRKVYDHVFKLFGKIQQKLKVSRREVFNIISFLHIPGVEMKTTIINH